MRAMLITVSAVVAALLLHAAAADAGCGCNKPPPPYAAVRPAFAPPGYTVTIFNRNLDAGKTYRVGFGDLSTGGAIATYATAVRKRDLADGVVRTQLPVTVPANVPPGPTRIRVKKDDDLVVGIAATDFTTLQAPIALAEGDGQTTATCYRAAVGADGTVYFPVDISAIAQHMIFSGIGMSYPLLFGPQDVTIYNAQGFLMQLLTPDQAGIYAITDPAGAPNSLELIYDRHEFLTYRDQHAHIGGYGLDPSDLNWHTDGTYHVDHDHLILAIRGTVENVGPPTPGQTAPFELHVTTALADGTNGVITTRTIMWSTACVASAPVSATSTTTSL